MRAIQIERFGDPAQVLRVVDIEEPPPPGPHEVLVSVEVSPLNKHDLLVISGVLARRAGADLRLPQKTMGHASITVTAHIYADLYDDELDDVASALDALDDRPVHER